MMLEAVKKFINDCRKKCIPVCLLLIFLFSPGTGSAAEHTVERGETALQIAIDHDLTMEQLAQLNPGTDLEMLRVGDILTVPDEGLSFEEFLNKRYSEMLRINGLHCNIAADRHALCFCLLENISAFPLYDVSLKVSVRGQNGSRGEAEVSIPLIQVLPGEKLPVCAEVQNSFDAVAESSAAITGMSWSELYDSSFRIPEKMYTVSEKTLPGGIAQTVTVRFNAEAVSIYGEKKLNVLAAAYAADGSLTGVRSLYSDFYPLIGITVYSAGSPIGSVDLFMEAY